METNIEEIKPDPGLPKKNWFSKYHILGYVFLLAVFAAIVSVIYYLEVSNQPIDTTPIVHKDPTADWKIYTNTEYGFEFKYPSDGRVVENKTNSMRIENYLAKDDQLNLSAGEYYIEVSLDVKTCKNEITNPRNYQKDGYNVYQGFGPEGGDAGGIRFGFCAEKETETIYLQVTEPDEIGQIANGIFSTTRFFQPVRPVTKGVSVSKPVVVIPPQPSAPPAIQIVTMDDFARCLSAKGAILYGSVTCPHCQNEKKAFGTSFQFVTYVECTEDPAVCTAAGVTSVPTWILANGQKLVGEQNKDGFAKLAEATSCQLPSSE